MWYQRVLKRARAFLRKMDDIIARASHYILVEEEYFKGHALLRPLLRNKYARNALSREQQQQAEGLLASANLQLGRARDALPHFARAIQLLASDKLGSTDHIDLLRGAGRALRKDNQFEAATDRFSSALDLCGERYPELRIRIMLQLGEVDADQGHNHAALARYHEAAAAMLKCPENRTLMARISAHMTCAYIDLGDLPRAATCARQGCVCIADSNSRDAAIVAQNMAHIYMRLKEYERALVWIKRSFELRPTDETRGDWLICSKRRHGNRRLSTTRFSAQAWSDYRLCAQCEWVAKDLFSCDCARAHYCSIGCQRKHAAKHAEDCCRCKGCGKVQPEVFRCGRCRRAKYCSVGCQQMHWNRHKQECQK